MCEWNVGMKNCCEFSNVLNTFWYFFSTSSTYMRFSFSQNLPTIFVRFMFTQDIKISSNNNFCFYFYTFNIRFQQSSYLTSHLIHFFFFFFHYSFKKNSILRKFGSLLHFNLLFVMSKRFAVSYLWSNKNIIINCRQKKSIWKNICWVLWKTSKQKKIEKKMRNVEVLI